MDRVAVFGIGSTNLRSAVATPDGSFSSEPTVEPTRPYDLADQVVDAVDRLAKEAGPLSAVAVSSAGLIDKTTGQIRSLDTPEGETVDRIDVGNAVERAHGLELYLENDCNASALGEWYCGARDGHGSLAHVTFGTGIGAGVVERGRLVRGESAQAGEVGLIPIVPDGDLSSTGVTGAWEAYCSGRGIPDYVSARIDEEAPNTVLDPDDLDARAVFQAADQDDEFAQACLAQVDRYNAAGIGAICNAFNPGLLTIGGGVALHNSERILGGIERHLDEFCFVDRPDIRLSPLADDIGLYGALGTYLDATEGRLQPLADGNG